MRNFSSLHTNNLEQLTVFPSAQYVIGTRFAQVRRTALSNHSLVADRYIPLLLENTDDCVIDMQGSVFWAEDNVLPVMLKGCRNVTLKNFRLDFLCPSIVQAEILRVENSGVAVRLDTSYTEYAVRDGMLFLKNKLAEGGVWTNRIIEIDCDSARPTVGGDLALGSYDAPIRFIDLGCGEVYIATEVTKSVTVGNFILLRFGLRDNAGIFVEDCENIVLENIEVNYACGMAFLVQRSENITLDNCRVRPSGVRLFSAAADATHFVGCKGVVEVKNCEFNLQMDDALNVHGAYLTIEKIVSSTEILVKINHEQQEGVRFCGAGDEISFVAKSNMLGYGACEAADCSVIDNRRQRIIFKNPLCAGIALGDCVENITWYPKLLFHHNIVKNNRARGVLISTRESVSIYENTFATTGSAVKISGDMREYFESGSVRDVEISRNSFYSCASVPQWGKYIISIDPEIEHLQETSGYYHDNIRITSNVFESRHSNLLYVRSASNVEFKENEVVVNRL